MTQEEKAKAYDKALKVLHKYDGANIMFSQSLKEEMFPELAESEDERIRKAIKKALQVRCDGSRIISDEPVTLEEAIAWLEQQGQKPEKVSIWKHWKDGIAGNGEGKLIYLIKNGNDYSLSSCLGFECDYIELSELDKLMQEEKQGERKSEEVDNLHNYLYGEQESAAKYKVGDTVYYDSFGRLVSFVIANIVEDGTDNPMYEDKDGNSVFQNDIVELKSTDKKGMNLVEEDMTPFQKKVFCIIDTAIEEEQGLKQVCDELLRLAHDEIMQKPVDVRTTGYWHVEDVEQKPADETPYPETLEKAIDLYYNSYGNGEGEFEHLSLEKFRDIVHTFVSDYGQKPAWSEEDETGLTNTIIMLKEGASLHFNKKDIVKAVDWLRAIRPQNVWISVDKEVYVKEPVLAQKKDKSDPFSGFVVCCDHTLTPNVYERYMILDNIVSQNTWKPSEEQMEALLWCVAHLGGTDHRVLGELYEGLKKLKE